VTRLLRKLGVALVLTVTAGLPVLSAPQLPPVVQAESDETARASFRRAIAYSYLPGRSGQLFFLTRKYYPVMFVTGDYSFDGFSQVDHKRLTHQGDTHGAVWSYDVEIPLLFYGPGLVRPGQILEQPVTQQDLVPTYAHLIGAVPPKDALHGQTLTSPFISGAAKPRAILTLVFDQGGWQYYRAHPQAWPNIRRLMEQGSLYTRARVTHLDAETAVGHIAIGTGAYPYQHGVISNNFFLGPLGQRFSLLGPDRSPIFINSPSLADAWDTQRANAPIIASYAYADRAAIGMAGHGSLYAGGDRDLVFWYDRKTGGLTTNENYYQLPDYLRSFRIQPYLDKLLANEPQWFGHKVDNFDAVNNTPAQVAFDADVFLKLLEQEPIGQDETPDLVYLTLKSTDSCGHGFGFESDECRSVFMAQDAQVKRIVEAFERKVGKGRGLVVLTADHGGSPLTSLSGGQVIKAEPLRAELNQRLDKLDNGVELFYDMLASQFYVDESEMKRNGLSWEDLRKVLLDYELDGQKIFLDVLTRREVVENQIKLGLIE
jgi:predicted AlkP superfamily pyrophosphatase or phosphodiesterase